MWYSINNVEPETISEVLNESIWLNERCNAQMNTLVDQDDCDKTLWESESESSKTAT